MKTFPQRVYTVQYNFAELQHKAKAFAENPAHSYKAGELSTAAIEYVRYLSGSNIANG